MTKSIVFPDQGSQFISMGKELHDTFPAAKNVFQEIDNALNQNLSELIFKGPLEDLTFTENTQPAMFAVSMAVVRVLEKDFNTPITKFSCAAGHSLGEYSALVATKAIDLVSAAKLLKQRGQAMQRAVVPGAGGMIAVLGSTYDTVQQIALKASELGICAIANDNCPGQIVLSGDIKAIEAVSEIAKELGVLKCIPLKVSAPFHCSLMSSAAIEMENALNHADFQSPVIPVYHNILAGLGNHHEIAEILVNQITGQVRWRETIENMALNNVDTIVEAGAGKVLSGLTKRINNNLTAISIGTPVEIEDFVKNYM